MTALLDMAKESNLRLGFTDAFKSPTSHEGLARSALRPRLLLCLHGLGTNAGLQRMASLGSGVTSKDLTYVRQRYISVPALREAIFGGQASWLNLPWPNWTAGLFYEEGLYNFYNDKRHSGGRATPARQRTTPTAPQQRQRAWRRWPRAARRRVAGVRLRPAEARARAPAPAPRAGGA